jgi:hypothetical protein
MATQLSEDRMAQKQGYAPATYRTFEVEGSKTVYANSLVGVRADNGKVEPLNDSSNVGTPGYNMVGFTEEHSEENPADQNELGTNGKREIEVKFGYAVELDLDGDDSLPGTPESLLGTTAYLSSDHEFETASDANNVDVNATIVEFLASATDRAIVDIPDIPEQQ